MVSDASRILVALRYPLDSDGRSPSVALGNRRAHCRPAQRAGARPSQGFGRGLVHRMSGPTAGTRGSPGGSRDAAGGLGPDGPDSGAATVSRSRPDLEPRAAARVAGEAWWCVGELAEGLAGHHRARVLAIRTYGPYCGAGSRTTSDDEPGYWRDT